MNTPGVQEQEHDEVYVKADDHDDDQDYENRLLQGSYIAFGLLSPYL